MYIYGVCDSDEFRDELNTIKAVYTGRCRPAREPTIARDCLLAVVFSF